jgi:hypothetical protein
MKKLFQLATALLLFAIIHPIATASAQNTAFTYQGRVTDNGTNFTGAGRFQFALVTSTNTSHTATATANAPSGGFITGYTVTSGGNGYVTAPVVTVSGGGGSGATATATISGGVVTGISVSNPGNGGYTSAPTVTIAPPLANILYTTYWSNDGTSVNGSEPTAVVSVPVTNGLFTVVLGDTTVANMAAIGASLFNQPNLQLRIWFNDGVNGFAAISPVQSLTPAPYAVFANAASTASNLISSAQLNVTGLSIQTNTNGAPNMIGGASANYVSNSVVGATIAGGGAAYYTIVNIHEQLQVVSFSNSVTANFGTVSGGEQNVAGGYGATVAGGKNNVASGYAASVGGGSYNTASGSSAVVSGGNFNTASGDNSIVCGGNNNLATNSNATVGGGEYCVASANNTYAAGFQAFAVHQGAFVWADSQSQLGSYASDRANQFKVRAGGGVQFDVSGSSGLNPAAVTINSTSGNGIGLLVNENSSDTAALFANGGTGDIIKGFSGNGNTVLEVKNDGTVVSKGVTLTSDRNAKQNFTALDNKDVLAKVVSLPVTKWNYKDDAADQKHIGPMAQDFHAAFALNGSDDRHISVIDEGGVAFAAIQGLNQKLEADSQNAQARIEKLEAENAELKTRLEKLEKLLAR